VSVRLDDGRRDFAEIPGKGDERHVVVVEHLEKTSGEGLGLDRVRIDDSRRDAVIRCSIERARGFVVAYAEHDLRVQGSVLDRIDHRLEVAASARSEDGETEGIHRAGSGHRRKQSSDRHDAPE